MAAERAIPISNSGSNVITVNADGTISPPGGVSINAGGVAKFEVVFPDKTNTCHIPFDKITFTQELVESGGTVKVGS